MTVLPIPSFLISVSFFPFLIYIHHSRVFDNCQEIFLLIWYLLSAVGRDMNDFFRGTGVDDLVGDHDVSKFVLTIEP
jgi:hypothetical protein